MDELAWAASSSCGPPFPVSFSAASQQQHPPALEFMSCDVPEQWMLAGDVMLDTHDEEEPRGGGRRRAIQPPPAPLAERSRGGRKQPPGPRADVPTMSHVEAERRRRDKLNRRFCDLRAAVPRVSRMDKASILADAVAYIAELRGRVEQLEEEAASAADRRRTKAAASLAASACSFLAGPDQESSTALEARMVEPEVAALRLRTAAERHAAASLMVALRALDLPVQHACVCRVAGVTVQDVVVDVPAPGLRGEGRLRAALHGLLLQERAAS